MHIRVRESGGRVIDIRIPTRLFLNSVTATVGVEIFKSQLKSGKLSERADSADLSFLDGLTAEQARFLFREINRAKVQMRRAGIPLVEVKDSGGDEVLITL